MDIVAELRRGPLHGQITTVDLHTAGEPTRVVIAGFPTLSGPLLAQRRELRRHHDHLRRRLILEPRGHWDMYGALPVARTELVDSGDADAGVLFMTNDGWSTMCGHATLALGRFLVDTRDETLFPGRQKLPFDAARREALVRLHAPCGVVTVAVPTTADGSRSDPARPVEYESVPSFATALDVEIAVPPRLRWPELGDRSSVTLDFAYGGAFYGLVPARELGFSNGLNRALDGGSSSSSIDVEALRRAADTIMEIVNTNEALKARVIHSAGSEDLEFLYSVIITDDSRASTVEAGLGDRAETGLCFFADSQVDRSPTGSGVQARVARAYARGTLAKGESVKYHSLVTRHFNDSGAFVGRWTQEVQNPHGENEVSKAAVTVRVSGFAYYTGTSAFISESGDSIGEHGFSMKEAAVG